MSAFDHYATPPPDARFSAQYFNGLDFDAASKLLPDYPVIEPHGSLRSWVFDTLTPADAASTSVVPGEHIATLSDLLPITGQLEAAFNQGSRSVQAQFVVGGELRTVVWHFVKIRLFIAINNNQVPVQLSSKLLDHVEANSIVSGFWRPRVKNLRIHAPIVGFVSAPFPVWKFGYLLDEGWVEEDLANALAEFIYLQNAHSDNPANVLILPTLAYNETVYLLGSGPHRPQFVLSPNLVAIRERIQAARPAAIYLLVCESNHYCMVKYDCSNGQLEHRDSLGHGPSPNIYRVFQTLLYGLDVPQPGRVTSVRVPMQVTAHGSCAIAALNFMAYDINPSLPPWMDSSSTYHRDVALRNSLIFHFCAVDNIKSQHLWYGSAPRAEVESHYLATVLTVGPLGFEDFNCFDILDCHPISTFETFVALEPSAELRYSPPLDLRGADIPSVSGVGRTASSLGSSQAPLSEKAAGITLPSISALLANCGHLIDTLKPRADPEVILQPPVASSVPSFPRHVKLETFDTPMPPPSEPDAKTTPNVKRESQTPPAFTSPDVTDLTQVSDSPSTKKKGKKRRPRRKVKVESDIVIDVCTPSPPPSHKARVKVEVSTPPPLPSRKVKAKVSTPPPPPPSHKVKAKVSTPPPPPSRKVKIEASPPSSHKAKVTTVVDVCTPPPTSPPPTSSQPVASVNYIIITDSDSPSGSPQRHAPPAQHPTQPGPQHTVPPKAEPRSLSPIIPIQEGTVFSGLEAAKSIIFRTQEKEGFRWHVSQSKRNARGERTKVTLRCRQYYHTNEAHDLSIDPAEQRTSKSVRSDCYARVNLNRIGGTDLWKVTLVDFQHNHDRELAEGGSAPPRVTEEHRDLISKFVNSTATTFTRSQLSAALKASFPTQAPLEPRQISNVINSVKREADAAVQALGGDVMAVLAMLQALKDADPNWVFYILLDDQQRLVALWWQNPVQAELTRRYGDVLLNDNTYNRNKYGFPLNIGIIIDGFGHSRNAWYCFQEIEDADTHAWVFRNHLQSAGRAPDALISDRSPAIILAASRTMPTASHIYCLYHLEGSITTNLRPVLGAAWEAFKAKFWAMYLAPAPELFEQKWSARAVRAEVERPH